MDSSCRWFADVRVIEWCFCGIKLCSVCLYGKAGGVGGDAKVWRRNYVAEEVL